jgi:hypothetical protein
MKTVFTACSLALALAGSIFWLYVPAYKGGPAGEETKTLVEVNGSWTFVVLTIPVVMALVPILYPHRVFRIISAVLITLFALLGSMTVGLAYFPAAVMMSIAACFRERRETGSEGAF